MLRRVSALAAISALALAVPAAAANLSFVDFSNTAGTLALNGNAGITTDAAGRQVLRLTPAVEGQAGSSFSLTPILVTGDYAFSTRFTFNINSPGGLAPADGLAFVIQPNSSSVGAGGSGLGISGIPKSFGVEFDTFPAFADNVSDQHVAIDFGENVNGDGDVVSSATATLPGISLADGTDWTAWIDYDGSNVEVRLANGLGPRPTDALLSYAFDLAALVGDTGAYVGFTASTGSGFENHDIVSWEFRDSFQPLPGTVPEPSTWLMMAAGFGITGMGLRRRARLAMA